MVKQKVVALVRPKEQGARAVVGLADAVRLVRRRRGIFLFQMQVDANPDYTLTVLDQPRKWFVWSEYPQSSVNMDAQLRDWAFDILRYAQFHFGQSLVSKINGTRWAAYDPIDVVWFSSIGFDVLPSGELSVVAEHVKQLIPGGPSTFHHTNPWLPTVTLMNLSSNNERLRFQIKKYLTARSFINQTHRLARNNARESAEDFVLIRMKAISDYAEHRKIIDYIEEYDRLIKKAFADNRFFEIDDLSAIYNPNQAYRHVSPLFVQWFERIITSPESLIPADLPVFNIHPDDLPLFATMAVVKYEIDESMNIADDFESLPAIFFSLDSEMNLLSYPSAWIEFAKGTSTTVEDAFKFISNATIINEYLYDEFGRDLIDIQRNSEHLVVWFQRKGHIGDVVVLTKRISGPQLSLDDRSLSSIQPGEGWTFLPTLLERFITYGYDPKKNGYVVEKIALENVLADLSTLHSIDERKFWKRMSSPPPIHTLQPLYPQNVYQLLFRPLSLENYAQRYPKIELPQNAPESQTMLMLFAQQKQIMDMFQIKLETWQKAWTFVYLYPKNPSMSSDHHVMWLSPDFQIAPLLIHLIINELGLKGIFQAMIYHMDHRHVQPNKLRGQGIQIDTEVKHTNSSMLIEGMMGYYLANPTQPPTRTFKTPVHLFEFPSRYSQEAVLAFIVSSLFDQESVYDYKPVYWYSGVDEKNQTVYT
jgi:hypothetical protein